jgi:Holliday junction resolvase RusA-like endonuclease
MTWSLYIQFELTGNPVPYARVDGGRTTHKFVPKRQREYANALGMIARITMKSKPVLTGPVLLRYEAKFSFPKKGGVSEGDWHIDRPDRNNIEKLLEDALKKVVWDDDSQVAFSIGKKFYSAKPLLAVRIYSWRDDNIPR